MSGIKGVIKYISQLLILSSFSIIFLPIICLKCYEEKSEISIFKFMQWSIGKSTKSFLYENNLEAEILKRKAEVSGKKKLYQGIGILGGLLLAVLLV